MHLLHFLVVVIRIFGVRPFAGGGLLLMLLLLLLISNLALHVLVRAAVNRPSM